MKNQALFSSKDKSKQVKCHLLQFLFGVLRINGNVAMPVLNKHVCPPFEAYIYREELRNL